MRSSTSGSRGKWPAECEGRGGPHDGARPQRCLIKPGGPPVARPQYEPLRSVSASEAAQLPRLARASSERHDRRQRAQALLDGVEHLVWQQSARAGGAVQPAGSGRPGHCPRARASPHRWSRGAGAHPGDAPAPAPAASGRHGDVVVGAVGARAAPRRGRVGASERDDDPRRAACRGLHLPRHPQVKATSDRHGTTQAQERVVTVVDPEAERKRG